MHQLHYGLLIAVFRILLNVCLVSGGGQYKKTALNRFDCRLECIICRFLSKISLSEYPTSYELLANYPVFH